MKLGSVNEKGAKLQKFPRQGLIFLRTYFLGAMTWDIGMPEAVEKRKLMMAWTEN